MDLNVMTIIFQLINTAILVGLAALGVMLYKALKKYLKDE